jgi:alkylation response protein AidB-like acyl-CoA dehydrogenase
MHAALTREQAELKQVADRLADSVAIRNPSDLDSHDREKAWRLLVNAGALSLRSRENGEPLATGTDVRLFVEAVSAALMTAPLLGNTLAVDLLARAGSDDDLVESIGGGKTRAGLLLSSDLITLAGTQDGAAVAWDVEGAQTVVGLEIATGGTATLVKFAVDARSVTASATDATRSQGKVLVDSGVPAGTVSAEDLQRWHALALTLAAADALGAARQTLENAIAYSKERYAYGVPIGSFQALQHLMVEAYVDLQPAAALTHYAAWAVDALESEQALLAARCAKAQTARVALGVAETAMQVFGGIGVTQEHIAHLFSRRVIVDRSLFGAEDLHYSSIADARLAVN